MRKILIIFAMLIAFTVFAVIVISTPSNVLYFLNWGEYIDDDLVTEFEDEYNCQVEMETVTSSEAMYQKIVAGTTAYDVAVPGDYTVKQLYNEGYLEEMDVENSSYEYLGQYDTMFTDSLEDLIDEYFVDNNTVFNTYFMPYFWGAYSIIYNETYRDVVSNVETNGFAALYDKSMYDEDINVGMYSTSRWAIASYLMAEGYNPNITDLSGSTDGDFSDDLADQIVDGIANADFDEWGDDSLKREVATHDLDMCFTQLGDFFDALYLMYDEGSTDINFNVYIPTTTTAFFDSLVIPTTCEHYELANEFINFMMNPENAYTNAQAIGYCPTLKGVVSLYEEDAENGAYYYGDADTEGSLTLADFLEDYPMYLDPLYNSDTIYMLEPKSTSYLTTCETIINEAKLK